MNLKEWSKKFKSAMQQTHTGPLIIAEEVVNLANDWGDHQKEADGLSVSQWLTRELGNKQTGLAYFKRRHDAVLILGEDIRRTIHHEVAVYVMNNVPDVLRGRVKELLIKGFVNNNHNPLTPQQAKPVIYEVIGKPLAASKECLRCLELEAEIERLKIEIEHLKTMVP